MSIKLKLNLTISDNYKEASLPFNAYSLKFSVKTVTSSKTKSFSNNFDF
jgi:hypothetical protein